MENFPFFKLLTNSSVYQLSMKKSFKAIIIFFQFSSSVCFKNILDCEIFVPMGAPLYRLDFMHTLNYNLTELLPSV